MLPPSLLNDRFRVTRLPIAPTNCCRDGPIEHTRREIQRLEAPEVGEPVRGIQKKSLMGCIDVMDTVSHTSRISTTKAAMPPVDDITVDTWDEARTMYRSKLEERLKRIFDLRHGRPDPENNTPLNVIMNNVPFHLLEESTTGVAMIEITVQLMRGPEDVPILGRTPVPDKRWTVKLNLDGPNDTEGRTQLPHIGFSVEPDPDGTRESHVFVREPLPKRCTVRGSLKAKSEPYGMGIPNIKRGHSLDVWYVIAYRYRYS